MRRAVQCLIGICFLAVLVGCSVKESKLDKQNDLEFTITEPQDLPEELKTMIEEKKEKPMKLAYGEMEELYLVVGYGSQETSGYSIEIVELYETENAVYIHTNLLGPSGQEEVFRKATYPYVAAKIQKTDKKIVFD